MCLASLLIDHGSPTLASLKVGSLFNVNAATPDDLREEARSLGAQLAPKGLALRIIPVREGHTLCYLYRPAQLATLLGDETTQAFLYKQGYASLLVEDALHTLCARLAQGGNFPHEIGLFLGYPLADVVAFIENKGKNYLCCGCFKAYTDECTAKKLFARFEKCTKVYQRLYRSGRTLHQLTVAYGVP